MKWQVIKKNKNHKRAEPSLGIDKILFVAYQMVNILNLI